MKRIFLAVALIQLLFALRSMGQGKVTGAETVVQFTGNNVPVVPAGTPAQTFTTGTNTFIIPLANPTVALRFYITNNTANACPASFTAQVWAVSDPSINTFNNALSNWQVIPLQSTTGGLVQALTLSIPASGISYFSTTAIAAPKVALQFVNVNNGCATTNLEVTATIFQVAVSSPLISANSPGNFGGPGTNVQGVVAQQVTAANVNPIVAGGLQAPSNASFTATGLDTFSINPGVFVGSTQGGIFTIGAAPAPSAINELAAAFEVSTGDNATGSIVAPWTCPLAQSQSCTAGDLTLETLTNVTANQPYQRSYTSASANVQDMAIIITFAGTTTSPRQFRTSSISASSTAFSSNTLAGSAVLVAVECTSAGPCVVSGVTDTQGLTYKQIGSLSAPANAISGGMALWMATAGTTAAADTITSAASSGVIKNTMAVEFQSITTAPLTYPAISNTTDAVGAELVRLDALAGNQFVCSVTLSTNTTTQCQAPSTTINGVAVRPYVTDFQINTTTAGTATTIQLRAGTGSNCGTGTISLSQIFYPNTTVGITSVLGMRTPLFPNVTQQAVCATQAGTTPGTSVVEIHGYFAP